MKVKALVMEAPRKVELKTVDVRPNEDNELQLNITGCGICAWDSYLFKGKSLLTNYPFQFGHEGVGVVEKVGARVKGFKKGDLVFTSGGADSMAQVINILPEYVAVLPQTVGDLNYCIGEPLHCVVNGIDVLEMTSGLEVVVIGSGYMGLLNIQALSKTLCSKITTFDIDDTRLGLAKKFGSDEVYNSVSAEGKNAMEAIRRAGGADIVFECSGSAPGFKMANELLKKAGKLSLFAWHRDPREFDGTIWHLGGLKIYNTSPMSNDNYLDKLIPTARLMVRGVFDQRELITHIGPCENAQELLHIATEKEDGYIKGVITF